MMAFSHTVVGVSACIATYAAAGYDTLPPLSVLAAAAVGSLLPDIDHPNSWAGRKMRIISVPLAALVGHRGVTHSLLATCVLTLGLLFFSPPQILIGCIIGYLSHLAADSLTPSGVPWLWPWKRTFSFNLFRTGSFTEYIFIASLALTTAWFSGYPIASLLPKRLPSF